MSAADKDRIEIEPMQRGDLDEVLWVEESSFRTPWSRKLFEEEFKNPELSHYLTARLDHHVVGYMGFWLIQDEAHITNLAVHPAFRRRQVASRLIAASLRLAWRLGARRATLEVRRSNQAAIDLYEKFGFQLVAIRRGYYSDNQEDALILWLYDLPCDTHSRLGLPNGRIQNEGFSREDK